MWKTQIIWCQRESHSGHNGRGRVKVSLICIVDDGTSRIYALMVDRVCRYTCRTTTWREYNLFEPYRKCSVCVIKKASEKNHTRQYLLYILLQEAQSICPPPPSQNVAIVSQRGFLSKFDDNDGMNERMHGVFSPGPEYNDRKVRR